MASLGMLFLQNGRSGSTQVVNAEWLRNSKSNPLTSSGYMFDRAPPMYSYLWYPQGETPHENLTYSAIYVWEQYEVVLATTSESYAGADGMVELIKSSLGYFPAGEIYEANAHQESFGTDDAPSATSTLVPSASPTPEPSISAPEPSTSPPHPTIAPPTRMPDPSTSRLLKQNSTVAPTTSALDGTTTALDDTYEPEDPYRIVKYAAIVVFSVVGLFLLYTCFRQGLVKHSKEKAIKRAAGVDDAKSHTTAVPVAAMTRAALDDEVRIARLKAEIGDEWGEC